MKTKTSPKSFCGEVVRWEAEDGDKTTVISVRVRDEDIRNGRVPWVGESFRGALEDAAETQPDDGRLTVEVVSEELTQLDIRHEEERDCARSDQREEQSELTEAHEDQREDMAARQGAARGELVVLLAILKREALAGTDSDEAGPIGGARENCRPVTEDAVDQGRLK